MSTVARWRCSARDLALKFNGLKSVVDPLGEFGLKDITTPESEEIVKALSSLVIEVAVYRDPETGELNSESKAWKDW